MDIFPILCNSLTHESTVDSTNKSMVSKLWVPFKVANLYFSFLINLNNSNTTDIQKIF